MALLPECLDDFIAEDNPVRVIDAFVDARLREENLTRSPSADRVTLIRRLYLVVLGVQHRVLARV